MIQDLDETIAALLRRDLPPAMSEQVQISFATPDDQFPSQSVTLPAIDLFLYDVRENLELRSNDVSIERRGDGTATRTRAPARVDFSYLITAWPSDSAPNPAEDEHRLLGEVMRVLLRYRTLPEDVLQGELRAQTPALPVSSLQPGRLQSMGEFWQAVGGKPKAALNYQVTLSVNVAVPEEVRLVTDKVIKIRMEQGGSVVKAWTEWETTRRQVAIGGRVLDHGERPVAGGEVMVTATRAEAVSGAGRQTWMACVSRADGIYYFLDLPGGSYTVRAVHGRSGAEGQATVSVSWSDDGTARMAVADLKLSNAARGG